MRVVGRSGWGDLLGPGGVGGLLDARVVVVADRPRTGAQVRGAAAASLVPVLDECMSRLERAAALQPAVRAEVAEARDSFAAIRQAADAWTDWLRSGGGRADLPVADMKAQSLEIDVADASDLLRVSTRHVRRPVAAGALIGRKHGTEWAVDRMSVAGYRS
jgi:hypothetical protein